MSTVTGWWVTDESARCPYCLQAYAVEIGCFCVDCDQPICPMCVCYVERVATSCPSCQVERDALEERA